MVLWMGKHRHLNFRQGVSRCTKAFVFCPAVLPSLRFLDEHGSFQAVPEISVYHILNFLNLSRHVFAFPFFFTIFVPSILQRIHQ